MKKRLLGPVLCVLGILLAANIGLFLLERSRLPVAHAQSSGSVVAGTYETLVLAVNSAQGFPFVTPPAGTSSGTIAGGNFKSGIQNFGQSSHWLAFCEAASTSFLTLELEASNDGTNWFAISEQGTLTGGGCGVLEGSGYFNFLRANVISLTGVSANVSAWYSSTGNAIPGGGVIKGGKSSQPVTFYPDLTFTNTALKSTPATITSSQAALDTIDVGNPNASIVYLVITGTTPSTSAVYEIAASSGRDIPTTRGVQVGASSTVACATAPSGSGDPTTGCVVTIHYKPFATINGQVGGNGSVLQTNAQIGN